MILEIVLGIVIAVVVLSMGRWAVGMALVVASFYFGFGALVVLAGIVVGLLWAVLTVLVFAFNRNERMAMMLSHPKLFARWLRQPEVYKRTEPTMKL